MRLMLICCAILIGSLITGSKAIASAGVDKITFMTEQYPPFNYEEQGKVQGMMVDILAEIFKKTNSRLTSKDIQLLPWARAYKSLQETPNTCLFSIGRSEAREKLFKWVGPVIDIKQVLLTKKSKKIKITEAKDLDKLQIGVIKDDYMDQHLTKLGIKKESIQKTSSSKANITKLVSDRLDGWAYGDLPALWELKAAGQKTTDFESAYVFETASVWFGFHKDTPQEVIDEIQKALDTIKSEGKAAAIIKKYTGT
ncbi:MAG: transporter substrate-binding domain-containing protein [Oligoflexales bacterium]|nr:transporter substrate-binding domain-containing protein [Oligoflexales bacterium]